MNRAFIALLALCASCASAEQNPAVVAPPTQPAAETPAPVVAAPEAVAAPQPAAAPADSASIESNARTYLVHFTPPVAAMPDNEPFELQAWITDAARPGELARDVTLVVSGAMPEHGHGMVREPIVERAADGRFVVRGVLLHMTGRWELYFDITRGAVTERAQVEVRLE